ncbi:MAG: hypothetical protein J6C26_02115 [Clostridia bacterium]|nr:hypothetical protein [Clostridia bacterium]
MTERILNILKTTPGVSDYRLNTVVTKSYELFFVHKKLETVRATDTASRNVTVYVKHGDFMGDYTFPVYVSQTDTEIADKVADAVKKAQLIDNPYYDLPAEGTLSAAADSNLESMPAEELGAKIADAAFAASCYANGSINALEVFLYRDEVSVINSRGTEKSEVRLHAMIEAIPTWNNGDESVEIYEDHRFTEFDAAAITEEIDRKMQEVRDRCFAKAPNEKLTCPVVLNAPELAYLAMDLAGELNYASVYNKTNAFAKGDSLQKNPTGDLLNITLRGRMKGSVRSALFDADGTAMTDTTVIEKGSAVGYYGASRFAQYLQLPPTGNLPCAEVNVGTLTAEELKAQPYFECISMSGLQLDIYNDYIGGEVRLAYYVDGDNKTPVTGISISGKLSDCLSEIRLSSTETVYGGYKGPDKALFTKIEIV